MCTPKSAWKAGSNCPPLAVNTALTTTASMVGKASFSVFSACCRGSKGRGGCGGAISSIVLAGGGADAPAPVVGREGFGDVERSSSSKSSSRAVVGDSGGPCTF